MSSSKLKINREQARLQFGALLASNVNYFGNIKGSTMSLENAIKPFQWGSVYYAS